jgi:hypothetical protein
LASAPASQDEAVAWLRAQAEDEDGQLAALAALLGAGGDADSDAAAAGFGGLEKGLTNDAKRLSEAFRKYSVVLQVCIYPSSYFSLGVSIQIFRWIRPWSP